MGSIAFRAPLAWLGPGDVVRDALVIADRGTVTFAGPQTDAPPIEVEQLVDLDAFLIPGAADRHVHIALADPAAVLLGGVTAVRDLAWPADQILSLADASEMPTFNGPLIRAAGPMLTAPDGYPTRDRWAPSGTGLELSSPEDA